MTHLQAIVENDYVFAPSVGIAHASCERQGDERDWSEDSRISEQALHIEG